MSIKRVDKVGKDIIAIIDKYLHREKWKVVNDEYIIKYLPSWNEREQCFTITINANDRYLDLNCSFRLIRNGIYTFPYDGVYRGKIHDNYIHAKLYN